MDTLKALCDDCANAKQACTLRRPVSRASSSIFLSRNDYQRYPFGLILHRGVIDAHALTVGLMNGDPTLDSWDHQVFYAHVRKGSAGHHLVITSTGTVAIEVRYAYPFCLKVKTCR